MLLENFKLTTKLRRLFTSSGCYSSSAQGRILGLFQYCPFLLQHKEELLRRTNREEMEGAEDVKSGQLVREC